MYGVLIALSLGTGGDAAGQCLPPPPVCDCPCADLPGLMPALPPVRVFRPPTPPDPFDVILLWNETTLRAIRADRTPPPLAARNLAILHSAQFDAMNAVSGTHEPFRFARRAPEASPDAAAAVAAHRTLIDLYPRQRARFDEALDRSLENVPDGPAKDDGVRLGLTVAEDMLSWRQQDSAATTEASTPWRGPGYWSPTPPDYRAALLPRWTVLANFCMRSREPFRPPGPPPLDSVAYAASFREVRTLGPVVGSTRTPDQTEIAFFWADDAGTATPPGHWNQVARVVSRERRLTPAQNARLFALLNLTLADAGILCWEGKYRYAYWRPIQGIRAADPADGGDPDWTPLLKTPPFPSYPSGHSTFSGAAAAVLARFFDTDRVRFTVGSDAMPGVMRSYTTFGEAAREAGLSRIYGGIHWDFDNIDGLASGRRLGEYVVDNFLRPRQQEGGRGVPARTAERRR
jgi:membrane-associated phospholipid phosphatase